MTLSSPVALDRIIDKAPKGPRTVQDGEKAKELLEPLGLLEGRLKQRIARASISSPETLFEELKAQEVVIDLGKKLA